MARTFGEKIADSERHEEESGWKKRLYNLLKFMNNLSDGDKVSFDAYMSKLERLVEEGIEENYDFPKISDANLRKALTNISFKRLSS